MAGGTPAATDTGELVAARQAYVEATLADLERARETYHKYLNAAAMVGLDVNTPEVEKQEKDLAAATQRHERALAALAAAEKEHEQATGREVAAERKREWDGLERLAAAYTASGRECTEALAALAVVAKKHRAASVALFDALPNAMRSAPHYSVFSPADAQARFNAEFERVVKGWPQASSGVPAPAPLGEIGADMEVMLRQARQEAGA